MEEHIYSLTLEQLVRLCADFQSSSFLGFIDNCNYSKFPNNEEYIEEWLDKNLD